MEKYRKVNGVAIIDVDDVLVFTTSLWFDRIVENRSILEPYMKENIIPYNYNYENNFLYNYGRSTYLFKDWLLREDLNEKEIETASKLINDIHTNNDFYSDPKLYPTQMASALRRITHFSSMGIDKIFLVTRTMSSTNKQKIEMLKFMFQPIINKIEIILIDLNEKKSDFVNSLSENILLIIDDDLYNIYDYLENCDNINNSLILIPETGYNTNFDSDKYELSKNKETNIVYYDYNRKINL